MALTPSTRLGSYEITAQIGEGGMGAVFRATDTSLGRQVAIKVLPDAFAADPDRLARFEREAKTLASLNHPHIAAIYAIEKSSDVTALVMELVEGDDLSQRIGLGAIPIDEALPIVFVASGDGASRLWIRPLATTTAQPLAGTDGATLPFWSPDGRSVGFFAGGALKRLDLVGGAPRTLAPAVSGRGGTWNAEGVIVFAPSGGSPLLRVLATGGPVTPVTTLDPQQQGHRMPFFLPDGRRILFTANGTAEMTGVYLGALDGSTPTRLAPDLSQVLYLPAARGNASGGDGWMLWGRANTLMAQRLDVDRQMLVGDLVTLADGMGTTSLGAFPGGWSVAKSGLVAYRTSEGRQRQLTWVDRSGTARGTVGEPDGSLQHPRVSPDGRRVLVDRIVQRNVDLWLLDGARTSRLTFDPARDDRPLWSPDGTRIVFRSQRTGEGNLYQGLANGAGEAERLVAGDQTMVANSWSLDGRFLLYMSIDPQTSSDLWVVPMVGDRTPSVFLKTPFREAYAAFSPDGRWVAYQSDGSGRAEVCVRPFVAVGATDTAAGGQWQVSTAGGVCPRWRPDGKELYYLNPAGEMLAAPITVVGGRARTRRASRALSHAHRGWRGRYAGRAAVRRRPRRALPDQHGTAWRRHADHAHPELESWRDEVARTTRTRSPAHYSRGPSLFA